MTPIDGERSPKADRYAKRLPGGPIKPPRSCPLGSAALMITFAAASLSPVRLAVSAARGARPGVPPSWRRDNGRGRRS